MKIIINIYIPSLFSLIFLASLVQKGFSDNVQDSARLFMLSNYISSDYENAVRDGKVISDFEYSEMKDFCSEIISLARGTEIEALSYKLCHAIENKEDVRLVRELANKVSDFALKNGGLRANFIPDFKLGEKIYKLNCASCHGERGEGYKVQFQDSPSPSPLTSPDISPVKVFTITKFGIDGTRMVAFDMSDKERWSLSFFVSAMRYILQEDIKDRNELIKENGFDFDDFSLLSLLSSASNYELENRFGFDLAKRLRFSVFHLDELSVFSSGLRIVIELIEQGKISEAKTTLDLAYFIFEGVESKIAVRDFTTVKKIELLYRSAHAKISEAKLDEAKMDLNEILSSVDKIKGREIGKSFSAFVIVFREGFEAILIISAILGIVSITRASKFPVYLGTVLGIVFGILLWIILGRVVLINPELMEGFLTLVAVLVILYVSFWLLENSRQEKIRQFIEKTKSYADLKNYTSLFLLSFFAVSREAGEAALFLRAIGDVRAMFYGIILGVSALFVVAFLIYFLRIKLKPRIFFVITNIILNFVAVALLGKAIAEFQEAGIIPITFVKVPSFDFFGIFPTLQTIIPQLILFVFLFGVTIYYLKVHHKSA
jgi:high-affinity iron transporter